MEQITRKQCDTDRKRGQEKEQKERLGDNSWGSMLI